MDYLHYIKPDILASELILHPCKPEDLREKFNSLISSYLGKKGEEEMFSFLEECGFVLEEPLDRELSVLEDVPKIAQNE